MGRASNLWGGGHPNLPENFSQLKHGNLSRLKLSVAQPVYLWVTATSPIKRCIMLPYSIIKWHLRPSQGGLWSSSSPSTPRWWSLFYAENDHSGHYGRHVGIHCNVACASIEIQIICKPILSPWGYLPQDVGGSTVLLSDKNIWLFCRILNI